MKFAQNNHPTRLFGPTCLFGTWEYVGHHHRHVKTVSPKRVVTIVNSSAHFMTISGHFSANHIDIFEVKHLKMTTEPQFCERC